jgi:hypothetical protein
MKMRYYIKRLPGIYSDTFIMCVDELGSYSIASAHDPEPEGFIGPVDPFAMGYQECSQKCAETVLGYKLGDTLDMGRIGECSENHPSADNCTDRDYRAIKCPECDAYICAGCGALRTNNCN